MFEKIISEIYDNSIRAIKERGDAISFDDLNSIGIHPSIIKYLSADLEDAIRRDRAKLLEKSSFDYSGVEIDKYFELIVKSVKAGKKFDAENISPLIHEAISFNVFYLSKPKQTLYRFVFDDDSSKTIAEIERIFNYIFYSDHIKNIFLSYAKRKRITEINYSDFKSIIEKAYKELLSKYPLTIVNEAMNFQADFYCNDKQYKDRLSKEMTLSYFEHFDLKELAKEIDNVSIGVEKDEYRLIDARGAAEKYFEKERKYSRQIEEESNLNEDAEQNGFVRPSFEKSSVRLNFGDAKTFQELTSLDESELIIKEQSKEAKEEKDELTLKENLNETLQTEKDNSEESKETIKKKGNNIEESGEIEENAFDESKFEEEEEGPNILELVKLIAENDQQVENEKIEGNEHNFIENADEINAEVSEENNEKALESEVNAEIDEIKKAGKDLISFVDPKKVQSLIEELFDGDMNDFVHELEKIQELANYSDALGALLKLFRNWKINPASKEAEYLNDVVLKYFNQ